ncbi:hypothetical protein [Gordonia amicalis]|uniref:hypothetical protein n=1 Tax=Gordonia amicalis TaxID=89053 RepID=UPI0002A63FFB|nr:hypothetical protein [Gordonia amicalis]MBA5847857.1 hypothetical protein [Gordonia amicalis]MDV7099922.1 hypothetical protein [Gordonia amicalis]MDV7174260.1 hypothetical protein [Gordonia amicalis]NKX77671.1 hypothetical protein [Gordonia amicalis]GAC52458.1 hypothetical protein GOAMI_13_00070 [Gordonia amicalis NBRC 100051 = JCM 11271]
MTDPTPSHLDVPLLVVDGANVVGSVPDGWWRDRRGAAERLRDRLAELAAPGIEALTGPLAIMLVVEGRARGIASVPGVTVVEAQAVGDDMIVDVVGRHPDRRRVVVTADRELRARVTALGAETLGPSSIPR